MRVALAAILTALLGGVAFCQDVESTAPRPDASAALVSAHTYDFDRDADSDGQPDYWERPADPSYPYYVQAGLDLATAQSGVGSLRVSGGGAPARLMSPPIALEGTAAYDVTGYVKAESLPPSGLRASSAFLAAILYDKDGKRIAVVKGFPEVTGTADWTLASIVDVSRKYPDAASLRVAVFLEGAALTGAAWFDTIEVQKRPLAFFKTNQPGNAFHFSQKKVFSFEARGLHTGAYSLDMRLLDAEGKKVHEVSLRTETAPDGTAFVQYTLPPLPLGPYTMDMDLSADGVSVLRQSVHIGVLPDYSASENARSFGVSLSSVPDKASSDLDLTELFHPGWVKLPLRAEDASSKASHLQMIGEMRRAGMTPIGVLDIAPSPAPAGGNAPDGSDLLDKITHGPDVWTPLLGDTVNTFAGSVQWWQLGSEDDLALANLQKSPAAYDELKGFVNGISFQARIGLPAATSGDITPSGAKMADFFTMSASGVAQQYGAAQDTPPLPQGTTVWAWTDMADWAKGDAAASASRAAADISGLFAAGTKVIFLRDPWQRLGILDNEGNITPFSIALYNIIHEVGSCEYGGTFSFPNGTPNAIFSSGEKIKVLMWPSDDPKEERLFLGDAVEVIDMYGRRAPAKTEDGENVILVKDGPIILQGLDPGTVDTRKTFTIEPGVIDSVYEVQPVYVSFTNKFATGIMGELTLKFPPGWEAQPRLFFIRLKPGESFRGRANLIVPYNALAGRQTISATLNLGGTQRTTIVRPVELGSTAFRVEMETRASGSELMVYQKVTNLSDAAAEVNAFLEGDGLERTERLPRSLDKGGSTTFSYSLGDPALWQGKKLHSSIRERQTNRFLNLEFVIPPPPGTR